MQYEGGDGHGHGEKKEEKGGHGHGHGHGAKKDLKVDTSKGEEQSEDMKNYIASMKKLKLVSFVSVFFIAA